MSKEKGEDTLRAYTTFYQLKACSERSVLNKSNAQAAVRVSLAGLPFWDPPPANCPSLGRAWAPGRERGAGTCPRTGQVGIDGCQRSQWACLKWGGLQSLLLPQKGQLCPRRSWQGAVPPVLSKGVQQLSQMTASALHPEKPSLMLVGNMSSCHLSSALVSLHWRWRRGDSLLLSSCLLHI